MFAPTAPHARRARLLRARSAPVRTLRTAGDTAADARRSSLRPAVLVFTFLCCLYALTAGGLGYSVDGTFSYQLARAFATAPRQALTPANRQVLRRWGPLVPLLGTPFVWAGERLAQVAPRRDTVPIRGTQVQLFDWPAIGATESPDGEAIAQEITLQLESPVAFREVQIVSFLSFATDLATGTAVAQIEAPGAASTLATLRAGADTAEWAYDVPSAERPAHERAPVAGHWPGNPAANLYVADLPLTAMSQASALTVRYLAPRGRLHLRSVVLRGQQGDVALGGPPTWSLEQQADLFSRFGFAFLNVPLMALTCALLVPLGRLLGYSTRTAVTLALVVGTATLAWPYAKEDFSEAAAGAFALSACVLALAASAPSRSGRVRLLLALLAGTSATLAAAAKYTAAWVVPLLVAQLLLWYWRSPAAERTNDRPGRLQGSAVLAYSFLFPACLAGLVVLRLGGSGPNVLAGWRSGLATGWLDFPLWDGLYGLLLSPGKSLFLYAPPLLLAAASLPWFWRRHGWSGVYFWLLPVVYLVVFGSKGVWSGGGWGPRYLVPVVPLAACLALPLVSRVFDSPADRARALLRVAVGLAITAGVLVQLLAVGKHPNLYTIMFRDHVLPSLPDYGAPYGGRPALEYWRHFGGPEAGRQLRRPPQMAAETGPTRGLGYLFAEHGPLELTILRAQAGPFALTLYSCDWDHRHRRQSVVLEDALGTRSYDQDHDFSGCEYLTWPATVTEKEPLRVRVEAIGPDVPVLSAFFIDPAPLARADQPTLDAASKGEWVGRFGSLGAALFAWQRGGQDVTTFEAHSTSYSGGDRDWIDTGEADLEDTALLYAPPFSPLAGHAWLLASDAVTTLFPRDVALQQRVLASPPWRRLFGIGVQPPHPEYGLGLDFWPLLLRDSFRSHPRFMALVWGTTALLALGALASAALLSRAVYARRG